MLKVRSPDGNTDYFDIVASVLQRRYISPMPVYYLPRLRAKTVYRFNERKQLQADKEAEGTKTNLIYLIYMYKEDLALNNLQLLICHKNQPNQILYI